MSSAVEPLQFCVPGDHPALAGHFPGRPVVPAVVILDQVLAVLAVLDPALSVCEIVQSKFSQPLLPGQVCTLRFEIGGGRVRFTCTRDCKPVASGVLRVS